MPCRFDLTRKKLQLLVHLKKKILKNVQEHQKLKNDKYDRFHEIWRIIK